jgi:multicomponent Na+:H+ antiporter subunit C
VSGDPASVLIYALAAIALTGIGVHALAIRVHLLRRLLALNILSSAVFLLLVTIARRAPGSMPDPVPHAMVLTGIVVALSATALALILIRRIFDATGRARLPDDPEDGAGAP